MFFYERQREGLFDKGMFSRVEKSGGKLQNHRNAIEPAWLLNFLAVSISYRQSRMSQKEVENT